MCAFAHVLACGKDGSCHTVAFLEFAFANSPILVCAFAHVLACGKDGKHGGAGPRKRGAQRRVRRLERKRNAGQPGFWLVSNQPKSRPYKKTKISEFQFQKKKAASSDQAKESCQVQGDPLQCVSNKRPYYRRHGTSA